MTHFVDGSVATPITASWLNNVDSYIGNTWKKVGSHTLSSPANTMTVSVSSYNWYQVLVTIPPVSGVCLPQLGFNNVSTNMKGMIAHGEDWTLGGTLDYGGLDTIEIMETLITSGEYGASNIMICATPNTKHSIMAQSTQSSAGAETNVIGHLHWGQWKTSDVITSIEIFTGTGVFPIGSNMLVMGLL